MLQIHSNMGGTRYGKTERRRERERKKVRENAGI